MKEKYCQNFKPKNWNENLYFQWWNQWWFGIELLDVTTMIGTQNMEMWKRSSWKYVFKDQVVF